MPLAGFYGRSRGKALRAGQKRLLAEALPLFSIAPESLADGAGVRPDAAGGVAGDRVWRRRTPH